MPTYHIQVLDDQSTVIAENVTNFATLDGVLVFQLDRDLGTAELIATVDTIKAEFPARRVLLLPPYTHFVRLVKDTEP